MAMHTMKSPFEVAAGQEEGEDCSPLLSYTEAGARRGLEELQVQESSFDDSDSIRMDELQSTVRLLSMSFAG